ncbi:type VI secretion system baseplate subunit TssG [Inquilinus sp. CA228]|uniref:type VI secretion system baseplate subunit TssG n=1 Tax=Inquilinus sp. CA228 TaxID=3455609 RepID=UPI003F8D60F8
MSEAGTIAAGLAAQAHTIAFQEAVRLLQRAAGSGRPIGTVGDPADEPVLFRSAPSLGFPAADIAAIRPADGNATWPAEMEVNFLGLYGPSSPLPAFWTERIVMDAEGAENLRDVLDLFGHGLVGLSYRIWRHHRLHLRFDGRAGDPGSRAVLALAGVLGGPDRPDDALDLPRLLPVCGLLAQHSRSAEVVRRVVAGYFGVPVAVEEWLPRMAPIPEDQRFDLGAPEIALGTGTVLGEAVPDIAGAVCVALGPLSAEQFAAFLPDGADRRALVALLHLAIREPLECRIDLILAEDEPGGLVLGSGRLGWTSWQGGAGTERRCPAGFA